MPRRAGRPPSAPLARSPAPQAGVPPPLTDHEPDPAETATATAFEDLFPADQTNVQCKLCSQEVADIPTHLQDFHPKVSLEMYQAEFPKAPLRGLENIELPAFRFTVTKEEADRHPGGREGAMTEKMLPKDERRLFREDIASLIRENFPVGHLLVKTAYQMVLHRRLAVDFERVQQTSKNGVFPGETFDRMQEISGLMSKNLAELEKMRANRITTESPLEQIQREQALAEQWVVEHQGEFTEACPSCGQILTPPSLPHWAFERVKTVTGIEHMVWSRELWTLVINRAIRLWVMAYTLRTSPEGIRVTALRRGEAWPEEIDLEVEEREFRRVLDAQDLQHRVGTRMLQLVGVDASVLEVTPTPDAASSQSEPEVAAPVVPAAGAELPAEDEF